ncbi:hypothetical protein GCM10025857_29770 [Alicyclobacillus contaminans]|nr:hypothetical protein GCM10025857_29770 [Alicyclobacillus contaminans]
MAPSVPSTAHIIATGMEDTAPAGRLCNRRGVPYCVLMKLRTGRVGAASRTVGQELGGGDALCRNNRSAVTEG